MGIQDLRDLHKADRKEAMSFADELLRVDKGFKIHGLGSDELHTYICTIYDYYFTYS